MRDVVSRGHSQTRTPCAQRLLALLGSSSELACGLHDTGLRLSHERWEADGFRGAEVPAADICLACVRVRVRESRGRARAGPLGRAHRIPSDAIRDSGLVAAQPGPDSTNASAGVGRGSTPYLLRVRARFAIRPRSGSPLSGHSYAIASRGSSPAARRAGKIAAMIPTMIAATTKTMICVVGNENTRKSTFTMMSVASATPRTIPRAAVQRRDDALVSDHAPHLAACHADGANIPISRVRSNTVRTSVLTIPKRLMSTERASRM